MVIQSHPINEKLLQSVSDEMGGAVREGESVELSEEELTEEHLVSYAFGIDHHS
jgi:hypothetical protein